MNDPAKDKDEKAIDTGIAATTRGAADESTLGPEDDDVYTGQGFDPEQRRFLWTMTGVLVLAILGASGINVAYMEHQRARVMTIARANDEYNTWKERLNQAQTVDGSAMINAYLRKDDDTFKRAMEDLLNAFRSERRAFIALRREQGFDEPPLAESFVEEYQNFITKNVMQQAEQARKTRQPATTQAGVTTAPAGVNGAATNP